MLLAELNDIKIVIDTTRFYVFIALAAYLPVCLLDVKIVKKY